jgi:DNA-binding NarL/FixJ family response regulator
MTDIETSPGTKSEKIGFAVSLLPETAPPSIRILLADEPSVFRDGLRALLASQSDMEVVGEAAETGLVLGMALQCKPDVILFEPDGAGTALSVLRSLQASELTARVILLTSSEDSELLSQALRHGACGIVSKKQSTQLLLKSIRKVQAGEMWLDRATTATVVRELSGRPIPMPRNIVMSDKPIALSRREREIVGLVAQGFRNREIADKLFISEQTVKNHMHNVFEKLGVQDRLELALYAIYHRMHEPASI